MIPLRPASSRMERCRPAAPAICDALSLPASLPENWKEIFFNMLRSRIDSSRALLLSLENCVHCGACSSQCHYFIGTGDPRNMPAGRAELLRNLSGTMATSFLHRGLRNREVLDESTLDILYTYFYQCSLCRRCAVFCPFGVDTSEITAAARECLAGLGIVPHYLALSVLTTLKTGNSLGLEAHQWQERALALGSEIGEEKGVHCEIPVDRQGAELLLVISPRDLIDGETLKGYASVFHSSGRSWTLSSRVDSQNFGAFLSFDLMQKINTNLWEVAGALGVKEMVFGESGHGFRVARCHSEELNGPLMERYDLAAPRHICQFTAELLRKGKLTLDRSANEEYRVTLHEPCALARAAGAMEEARFCLKSAAASYMEMPENSRKEYTFCCGGGGGLMAPELLNLRIAGALPRMEALKISEANYLAAPCETCRATFTEVLPHYRGPFTADVRSGSIHALIYRALQMK